MNYLEYGQLTILAYPIIALVVFGITGLFTTKRGKK
jgi:hypothetical protein